jgi:hypothetical protein
MDGSSTVMLIIRSGERTVLIVIVSPLNEFQSQILIDFDRPNRRARPVPEIQCLSKKVTVCTYIGYWVTMQRNQSGHSARSPARPRLEKANIANTLGAANIIGTPVLRSIHQHISFIILKIEMNCFWAPRQKRITRSSPVSAQPSPTTTIAPCRPRTFTSAFQRSRRI